MSYELAVTLVVAAFVAIPIACMTVTAAVHSLFGD